jgi:hypothetical protein
MLWIAAVTVAVEGRVELSEKVCYLDRREGAVVYSFCIPSLTRIFHVTCHMPHHIHLHVLPCTQ